jgi:hypothetical protein
LFGSDYSGCQGLVVITVVVNVPENSVALFFKVENKMEEGGSSVDILSLSVKNIGYKT